MIVGNFELRKVGSMDDLYKEVDMVLSKNNNAKAKTLVLGLQHMFKPGRHFDICFVKSAAEMCRVVIPQEHLNIYQILHCIDWSEMEDDYRATVMSMVLNDFRSILV